jgi:hypothetical protein
MIKMAILGMLSILTVLAILAILQVKNQHGHQDGQEDGHMAIFLRPLSTMVYGKAPKMANLVRARACLFFL